MDAFDSRDLAAGIDRFVRRHGLHGRALLARMTGFSRSYIVLLQRGYRPPPQTERLVRAALAADEERGP